MNHEKTQRLVQLANQLAESLMTAVICADEIRASGEAELDSVGVVHRGSGSRGSGASSSQERPLVEQSTLSVSWAGKTCYLGHTVLFRLADRLSRRPNQYITVEQLLRDVWEGGFKAPATVRSAIRHLRQRLSHAEMHDLATAIHVTGGRYGLILDGRK